MIPATDPATHAALPAYEPDLVVQSQVPMGQCYLVIDRTIFGRSWGGFRVVEELSLNEIRVLARTMTLKTMLAGIPIGGAKGGVSLSTSRYDRERMLHLTSQVVGPYIKLGTYFPGTDLGFQDPDVDYLYRSAGSKHRPLSSGLTVGEACARGISTSLSRLQRDGIYRYKTKTVAIEGFGRIGNPTARLLSDEGYRVVAVSNLAGAIHDASGLNMSQLLAIPACSPENLLSTYVKNHPSATVLPRGELIFVKSEILIPGARAFVIDRAQAESLKAKVICPISNAPVTTEGEEVLAKRGIISLPDIITNTGGVIASFAQRLGANVSQTENIISDVISNNLNSVFGNFNRHEVPKKKAVDFALSRLNRFQDSEKISAAKFLSPWIRTIGLRAILYGFKEFLGVSVGG